MSSGVENRLQRITTILIVVTLSLGAITVAGRITKTSSAGASVTTTAQQSEPSAAAPSSGKLVKEEYLMLADETCRAFSASTFKILPSTLTNLSGYLGELSSTARELHDQLSQISLPEGDVRELKLVLDQIERSASGLSDAVKAIGNDGEVAVEMAFEPSYAQALLGELNAGIHAWRAGLRECGPKPLETFEMNDIGEPLNSKLR